jgi:hypothetical protein
MSRPHRPPWLLGSSSCRDVAEPAVGAPLSAPPPW